VVAAPRPKVRERVDRTVYSITDDLQAEAGSVADLLRDVPSVDVDLDGNPSIRGDSGVQILIDGRPAPWLNGQDRGAILQMLGADNIASIEVITNPSARFRPDGSAGILNIVTKAPVNAAPEGVARAGWQSEGGSSLSLNGSAGAQPLSINGGINLRDDARKRVSSTDRAYTDPDTGDPVQTTQRAVSNSLTFSRGGRLGADYRPNKADTLTLELDYHDRGGSPVSDERDTTIDPLAGDTDYERTGRGHDYGVDTDVGLTWRRKFSGEDHELTLDIERGESLDRNHTGYQDAYVIPVQPDTLDEQATRSDEVTNQLTLNYKAPLPAEARLETGYDLRWNQNAYDNYGGAIDPVTGAKTPNAALTNRFDLGEQVHALYATYERPIGKLTLLAGLRLEATVIDADQQTSAIRDHIAYVRQYPSLHLQYALSDTQSLKLSWTQRAQRPSPGDLNPYLVYQDALNVSSGNPDLKPQTTDGAEASFIDNERDGSRSATLYWRETYDTIVNVSRYLSPSVLLTTKANLGQINSTGMDLAANGKPSKTFSYSLNGWLFYN
jgi:outer membrane receptor protein involved in Fe transport